MIIPLLWASHDLHRLRRHAVSEQGAVHAMVVLLRTASMVACRLTLCMLPLGREGREEAWHVQVLTQAMRQ